MSRSRVRRPSLLTSDSHVVVHLREWLQAYLGRHAVDGIGRRGQVNTYALTGSLGAGILAETETKVPDRPGVWRTQLSAWVCGRAGGPGTVAEAETHTWDAWSDAADTGDRRWLDVPRKRMYAERDRRTAALAAELDQLEFRSLVNHEEPGLRAGPTGEQLVSLAARHAPGLLDRERDELPNGPDWAQFEARVATALSQMPAETYLILSTAPGSRARRSAYVQFAQGPTELRAESVSDRHLPEEARLDAHDLAGLVGLGWRVPHSTAEEGPNHFQEWALPAPTERVAAIAVRTLREIHGAAHPDDLRYRAGVFGEGDPADPDLGILPEDAPPKPETIPASRQGPVELHELVEDGFRRWLGIEHPQRDGDGDYLLRTGSAAVFVRVVHALPPGITIFSPILQDVEKTPALLDELNEINATIRFARVLWGRGQVILAADLATVGLTAEQVALACLEIGNLADRLDGVLRGRFGGRTMFTDAAGLPN